MTTLSSLWCISASFLKKKRISNEETCCFPVGLERKLQASADTVEQLSKDKSKLQNDISDIMKESGDSSVQLTKMNQDLTEKEK